MFKLFKRYFLFLILIPILLAATYPHYRGYVNDYAGILSQQEIQGLTVISTELDQKTSVQLVTVIVNSLQDEAIEDYAIRLFEKWKIGNKEKNNGILFLTAIQERKTKIEVGYGLEGIINDAKAGRILDEFVVPLYKSGSIKSGVINGHLALAQVLAQAHQVTLTGSVAPRSFNQTSASYSKAKFVQFLFACLFFIFIFGVSRRRGGLLPLLLLLGMGSSGFSGRDSFGGFGGGGFGGFGGGFSGGGGAGRGW